MRLWSIQPAAVVEAIERDGHVFAAPDFAKAWDEPADCPWGFSRAYKWMAGQMSRLIGPPPPGAQLPMWAWARPPNPTSSGAPDLRSMRGAEPAFLLELEVPDSDVLLSDHGSWHMVLGGHCLGLTEADQLALEARLSAVAVAAGLPLGKSEMLDAVHYACPQILEELSSSWGRVFHLAPLADSQPASMAFSEPADPAWIYVDDVYVQACLWSIQKEHVLSVVPVAPLAPRKSRRPA